MSNTKKIILDTNFLMVPAQFKVDIFSEISRLCSFKYKLFILENTLSELKNISETQSGKNKAAARLAFAIISSKIKSKEVSVIKLDSGSSVDNQIVDLADEGKDEILVATQDMYLKKRLKDKCKIITLRQKKKLILV